MFASSQKIVQKYRFKQLEKTNNDKPMNCYKPQKLVYLISLKLLCIKFRSRKFRIIDKGPLVLYEKNRYISVHSNGY